MTSSDRVFGALLSLYPNRFRARFASEMAQVFHDCCCEGAAGPVFWMRTLKDSFASIVREWRREVIRPDCEIDYHGLVDSIMVAMVVGTNLLGWGWMGATIVLDLDQPFLDVAMVVLASIVTCLMALLVGTLSAILVSRNKGAQWPRIKVF